MREEDYSLIQHVDQQYTFHRRGSNVHQDVSVCETTTTSSTTGGLMDEEIVKKKATGLTIRKAILYSTVVFVFLMCLTMASLLLSHHPKIERLGFGELNEHGELLVDETDSFENKFTPSISYQVHSWNDLRQWIQGYQKGVRHFKVDIYYHIDYDHFIKSYGKLCKRSIRDLSGVYNGNRCLLLTHDPPKIGGPDNGMGYFDFIDLIETLTDIRNRFPDSTDRIYVALCLKYQKIMFNSNAGTGTYVVGTMKNPCKEPDNEWIILVDEMYQLFNSRNEKLHLNIEFILDESGTSGGTKSLSRKCLENKWQSWPYTFISARDSTEIFKDPTNQEYGWLFSKKKDQFSRFKYLNQPLLNDYAAKNFKMTPTHFLEEAQEINYGRFNNLEESKFLWEPSDQHEIWRALEVYSKRPAKKGVLRFSSNIDPIQMETFVSKYSNYGRNEPIPSTEDAKSPKIINIDSLNNILIVYEKSNNILYSIYDYNSHKISPPLKLKDSNGNEISLAKIPIIEMTGLKNTLKSFRLTVLFESGIVSFYKLIQVSDNWELILDRNLKIDSSDSQLLSFSAFANTIIVASKDKTSQSLAVHHYEIQKVEKSLELKLVERIQVPNKNLVNFESMKKLTIHAMIPTVEDISVPDILIIICYSTDKNNVYGTYMTVSKDSKDNYQQPKLPKLLGTGDHPSISSFRTSHASLEKTFVAIVWGEGFCNNGDEHNLQRFPYTCSLERLSCPNVLQYSFISVQEFIQSIQQTSSVGAKTNAEIRMREMNKVNEKSTVFMDYKYSFSPCKENMLFGCYDRGSQPSILLFRHHEIHNTISAIALHVGVSETENGNSKVTTQSINTNTNDTAPTQIQKKINGMVGMEQKYGESYTIATADDTFSSCASCGDALPYNGLVLDELMFSAKYLK